MVENKKMNPFNKCENDQIIVRGTFVASEPLNALMQKKEVGRDKEREVFTIDYTSFGMEAKHNYEIFDYVAREKPLAFNIFRNFRINRSSIIVIYQFFGYDNCSGIFVMKPYFA